MKFGKYIQGIASEWAEPHYINYKGLKKIIRSLEQSLENIPLQLSVAPIQNEKLQNLRIAFFYQLERELEKVNSFYLLKESELKVRSVSLFEKIKIISDWNPRLQLSAFIKLDTAAKQFRDDLLRLSKFVQVNSTGFRKILKKFDKRSKSTTKEVYLSRQIDLKPCFNNDYLNSISDQIDTLLKEINDSIEKLQASHNSRPFSPSNIEAELAELLIGKNSQLLKSLLNTIEDNGDHLLSRLFLRHLNETSIECVTLLLSTRLVDCNYHDDITFKTCFHEAVIAGNKELVELIINHGAENSAIDLYGKTPLHYACMYGHVDLVTLLLGKNCEVDPVDHDGNTPLIQAILSQFPEIASILIENKANINPLTPHSFIPLCLACEAGMESLVKVLLDNNAKILPTSEGMYPIHLSCRKGWVSITKILIDHGCDIEIKDLFYSWTPIFYAVQEGHFDCVKLLLEAGAQYLLEDTEGWIPLTYALYHSHIAVADLLSHSSASQSNKPFTPSHLFQTKVMMEDQNMEEIPSLTLPPPIIPLRIYGHKYLEKQTLINLQFSARPILMKGSNPMTSLKMVISSSEGIPYSFIFPFPEDHEPFIFQENTDDFVIEFEIYPTLGSQLIGKGIVLFEQLEQSLINIGQDSCHLFVPIVDSHLKPVGKVSCEFFIVTPFKHASLSIGGKIETYWKSAQPSPLDKSQNHVITSSLVEEYIELVVQLTKDLQLVVYEDWKIKIGRCECSIGGVSYQDARTNFQTRPLDFQNKSDLIGNIYSSFFTLEDILKALPKTVGVSIQLKYPNVEDRKRHSIVTACNINDFVDLALKIVYEHGNGRNVIYSSYNSQVCSALNWKQPNYGVFFATSCGYQSSDKSLKQSVKFAKESNLLGIICDATPLIQMPKLIKVIKESGLMLVSSGKLNLDPENVKIQEENGLDATIVQRVMKYNVFS